jgi:CRP-like cAMP-binding protein
MMSTLQQLLAGNPVFSSLGEADRAALAASSLSRSYPKGDFIVQTGDVWPYIFLVAEGSVEAVKESGEGRRLIVASFAPGELFWGPAFFHDEVPMPVTLEAHEPVQIFIWSRQDLLPLLLKNGQMAWELSRLMLERMLRASQILEELAFQPVAGRLARLLVDFHDEESQGPVARADTLDKMAARIGTTREVVCRFLYRFAGDGLIQITRTEFLVTDHQKLLDLARRVK